jgi:hypothetical protein
MQKLADEILPPLNVKQDRGIATLTAISWPFRARKFLERNSTLAQFHTPFGRGLLDTQYGTVEE